MTRRTHLGGTPVRRRIIAAAAALAAAVTAVAIVSVGLRPAVQTAAAPDEDGRIGGVAAAASTGLDGRVETARTPVAAPAPVPAPVEAAVPTTDSAEVQVLDLVNAERTANGCSPVAWDESLAQVARLHSADMAARDYFDHTNSEGLGPFDRAAAAGTSASAENIAAGQQSAAEAMASWMASPGHRDNILNCALTRLGVGVGYGGSYGITWTQLFG